MTNRFIALLLASVVPLTTPVFAQTPVPGGSGPKDTASQEKADPYLWLEEIEGAKAQKWVAEANKRTTDVLEASPEFATYRDRALTILNDQSRIAEGVIVGQNVLNFWQDETSVRGRWRRAKLTSYLAGKPVWNTVLDLDALATKEGKNWVWAGAECRQPDYQRCLVKLSDGGKDAHVMREFDMTARQFVTGGFILPEDKSFAKWVGKDALLVSANFGENSQTDAGYPRIVKLWQRGTPLQSAKTIQEGEAADIYIEGEVDGADKVAVRRISFVDNAVYHIKPDNSTVKWPLPIDARYQGIANGRAFAVLNSGWNNIPAGTLIAYPIAAFLKTGKPSIETVYTPPKGAAISAFSGARFGNTLVYVETFEDVAGKVKAFRRDAAGWTKIDVPLPNNGTVGLSSTSRQSDLALTQYGSFTTPTTLYAINGATAPKIVTSTKARFDASKFDVSQRFATSKDGTKIPYFVVKTKGVTEPRPGLQYGYGGFQVPMLPELVDPLRQFWIEEGNVYIVANIRGGGEYGPEWHAAALGPKRQNAYDDFAAVTEDATKAGIVLPGKMAAFGGSNGGLMAATVAIQRPDLYGAAISFIPVIDMKRFHLLLAGSSWLAEYGNPDDPKDWAYLSKYSPYHNIKPGVKYPKIMFYTSTKDDRVHPGHARKIAAKMQDEGHPVFFYESIDGGHAPGVNVPDFAKTSALLISYLNDQLPAAK
jgi:prolyl oligopeptidase